MALANYVPRISQEGACLARLGAHFLVIWPDDSSSQEKEDNEQEEVEEQGEVDPELPSGGVELKQGETEQEAKPRR